MGQSMGSRLTEAQGLPLSMNVTSDAFTSVTGTPLRSTTLRNIVGDSAASSTRR